MDSPLHNTDRRSSIMDFFTHKLAGRPCSAQIRRVKSTEALSDQDKIKPFQRSRSESTHFTNPPPIRTLPPHRYVVTTKSSHKCIAERVLSHSDITMIKTTSFDDIIKHGFSSPCSSPSFPITPTDTDSWLPPDEPYQPTLKLTLTPVLVQPIDKP